jgi:hypothetical protein
MNNKQFKSISYKISSGHFANIDLVIAFSKRDYKTNAVNQLVYPSPIASDVLRMEPNITIQFNFFSQKDSKTKFVYVSYPHYDNVVSTISAVKQALSRGEKDFQITTMQMGADRLALHFVVNAAADNNPVEAHIIDANGVSLNSAAFSPDQIITLETTLRQLSLPTMGMTASLAYVNWLGDTDGDSVAAAPTHTTPNPGAPVFKPNFNPSGSLAKVEKVSKDDAIVDIFK